MGFLRTKLFIALIFAGIIGGCGKSTIKVSVKLDEDPYPMFGKSSSRNFYVPVNVSDSLELRWESDTDAGFRNTSVSIYDRYVFTSNLGGRIYVFDIEDGEVVGRLKNSGSIYTTPLVFRSLVIFGVAEDKYNLTELIYYDYQSGKEIYYEELYSRIMSEMIALEDGIVFLTESGRINRYNLAGKSVWQTETNVTTRSSPSLADEIIIFGNNNGEVINIELEGGEIVKRAKFEGLFTATPTIDGDIAYLSNNNGKVYAVDLYDLEKIWEFDTGTKILMSPAIDDSNVIIGNLSGALFSLNKKTGKVNWYQKYKGLFNASPLLTENRIIIGDLFRSFYIIDKATGIPNNIYLLDGRTKLSPVYYDNTLFIGFDRGVLRAYDFVF
jgi:outer membrane protein assembly factor BamB